MYVYVGCSTLFLVGTIVALFSEHNWVELISMSLVMSQIDAGICIAL